MRICRSRFVKPGALFAVSLRSLRLLCDSRHGSRVGQFLIRLGNQVMISGKIMQSASPTIMSSTNGVADL